MRHQSSFNPKQDAEASDLSSIGRTDPPFLISSTVHGGGGYLALRTNGTGIVGWIPLCTDSDQIPQRSGMFEKRQDLSFSSTQTKSGMAQGEYRRLGLVLEISADSQ